MVNNTTVEDCRSQVYGKPQRVTNDGPSRLARVGCLG